MKRFLALAHCVPLLAVVLSLPGCAATRLPGVSYADFPTKDLPSAARCLVLEPPSYAQSPRRRYPVLVFLHDGYGDVRTLERRALVAIAEWHAKRFSYDVEGARQSVLVFR